MHLHATCSNLRREQAGVGGTAQRHRQPVQAAAQHLVFSQALWLDSRCLLVASGLAYLKQEAGMVKVGRLNLVYFCLKLVLCVNLVYLCLNLVCFCQTHTNSNKVGQIQPYPDGLT